MRQSNKKTPLIFRVSLVLICVFVFSLHLMGGLYARYTTTATGSDSARVARFNVSRDFISANIDVDLNFYDPAMLEDEIEFSVSSASEVTTKYHVVIEMPEGVDYSWLDVSLKSGENVSLASVSGNTFTFTDVGLVSANDSSEKVHTLIFSIKEGNYGNPGSLTDFNGSALLTIRAEQVD